MKGPQDKEQNPTDGYGTVNPATATGGGGERGGDTEGFEPPARTGREVTNRVTRTTIREH